MKGPNYRRIRLTGHMMKLYERLADSRLRELVPISQKQFGVMPERSTTDAIFIARQVMKKYREKRRLCYPALLDLKSQSTVAATSPLESAPETKGSRTPDLSGEGHVRWHHHNDTYPMTKPEQQCHGWGTPGISSGPFLFLITMDVITEELMDGSLKTILYSDDIALIAESEEELQDKLQKWQKVLAENGLRLNVKKAKFCRPEEGTESIVDGRGEAMETV
nr:RNA-directed DNA polymerase (reverse transcriptase) domain containing protein [Haemonchus contortus]